MEHPAHSGYRTIGECHGIPVPRTRIRSSATCSQVVWQRQWQFSDVAELIIYQTFIKSDLDLLRHLGPPVHAARGVSGTVPR
jgi:hypothetical protein